MPITPSQLPTLLQETPQRLRSSPALASRPIGRLIPLLACAQNGASIGNELVELVLDDSHNLVAVDCFEFDSAKTVFVEGEALIFFLSKIGRVRLNSAKTGSHVPVSLVLTFACED